ncbi:MAG: hypothetical protein C4529_04735, partial [Deltaproteobacteria bacterium]
SSSGPLAILPLAVGGFVVDGGYALQFEEDGGRYHGVTARCAVILFAVMPYLRAGHLFGRGNFIEAGVLLKVPVPLGM